MPKMKTHKGVKKRFKVSARGKVQHRRCNTGHRMSGKSGNRLRRLRKDNRLVPVIAKKVLRALSA
jgi:large subunit ribosomal protein L35